MSASAIEKTVATLEALAGNRDDPYCFWRDMGADDETIAEHEAGVEQDRIAFRLWFGRLSVEQHEALTADLDALEDPLMQEHAVYRRHGFRWPYGQLVPRLGKAAVDAFYRRVGDATKVMGSMVIRPMTGAPLNPFELGLEEDR